MLIAGEFIGNLNNDGERLRLEDALNENVLDFDYNDTWHPITDGTGFSLHIVNPATTAFNDWDQPASWLPARISTAPPARPTRSASRRRVRS